MGLSRRAPADLSGVDFVPLDLTDRRTCQDVIASRLQGVTHLVYTALYEKPGLITGWREQDQMQTIMGRVNDRLQVFLDVVRDFLAE